MNVAQPYFLDSTPSERRNMRIIVGGNVAVVFFCLAYLFIEYKSSNIGFGYIIFGSLIGYLCADFASGLVHWGIDTWFSENEFGRVVAIAREHHTHPQNILGYGFIEHAALGSAPSMVVIGPVSVMIAFFPISIGTYFIMIVCSITSACLLFGTSFHNLGHKRSRSILVQTAQKLHLVISPEHHWLHHRNGQLIRYCAINGWANHICDYIDLWRKLEWVIEVVTGATPRKDDLEWQRRYEETGTLKREMTRI